MAELKRVDNNDCLLEIVEDTVFENPTPVQLDTLQGRFDSRSSIGQVMCKATGCHATCIMKGDLQGNPLVTSHTYAELLLRCRERYKGGPTAA